MTRRFARLTLASLFFIMIIFGGAMIFFSLSSQADATAVGAMPTIASFDVTPNSTHIPTVMPPTAAPPTLVQPTQAVAQVVAAAATPITSWQDMPVIPTISERTKQIYLNGQQARGNTPRAFSKVGDCESSPSWFLGDFDKGSNYFSLGDYKNLRQVITNFQGSYARVSLAAKSGFSAAAVFAPLWANPEFCRTNESPLACEYRLHKPSYAFVMLGTNDYLQPAAFEDQLRSIVRYSINNGVVPILATKADNLEKDNSINASIVKVAIEFDVPLWNYWAAV
ncbi:MAG: SGNH/GDSL hydrolase family protein, partial [Chloroflexi bacterium]|nr:SGNH/GDSL hydrolase family protein [Chloroflexota bacterium]